MLDPVVIEDDMSGLWRYVTYNDDATAAIGQSAAGDLVVDAGTQSLVWTGALGPGEAVTITYSVTVNDNAGGQLLKNVVDATVTPPGQPPIEVPPVDTEHPAVPPVGGLPATGMPAAAGLVLLALLLIVAGVATKRYRELKVAEEETPLV